MKEAKKILIVEDDEGFRAIIKESFSDTEFEIVEAENGEDGLVKIKEHKPNIVLLDIRMPKMDGIQMAGELRKSGDNTPIIFLTNFKEDDKVADAMSVTGGDLDYIVKTDVRVEEIIERIRKRLKEAK